MMRRQDGDQDQLLGRNRLPAGEPVEG